MMEARRPKTSELMRSTVTGDRGSRPYDSSALVLRDPFWPSTFKNSTAGIRCQMYNEFDVALHFVRLIIKGTTR